MIANRYSPRPQKPSNGRAVVAGQAIVKPRAVKTTNSKPRAGKPVKWGQGIKGITLSNGGGEQ